MRLDKRPLRYVSISYNVDFAIIIHLQLFCKWFLSIIDVDLKVTNKNLIKHLIFAIMIQ